LSQAPSTRLRTAIFDVDGVLVDSPHEQAWREALRSLMEGEWSSLRSHTRWTPEAFTRAVYQGEVSGKPRMDGARDALAWFGVPDDEEESRVGEYAARKQAMLERLITAGDFRPYLDGLRFAVDLRRAGFSLAAASSSKNARSLLDAVDLHACAQAAGIEPSAVPPGLSLGDLFDVDVSGRDFEHGKPHPEMFLTAADELGVPPGSAVVVEDAAAGVQAAKAGGMPAIGVARADDRELLAAAGADLVVDTLDDVDRVALAEGRLALRRRTGEGGDRA
jgi:beta-phosphoglucomutase-like phosphatase (HAD superfamily)